MTRLRPILASLLVVGTAAVAAAQPPPAPAEPPPLDGDRDGDGIPDEPPADRPAAPPAEPPPPEAKPHVIRVMTEPPSAVPPVVTPVVRRPAGASVGLGAGWNFPTDLQVPNAFSSRFRLRSGLTIEPELALARADFSREDGLPPPENVTATELTLGVLVRKPLRQRGRADLELVGGLRLAQSSFDPEGENNTDKNVLFSINYGLAVGLWVTPHVQISVTALNPVLTAGKITDAQGFDADPIVETSTSLGAVWDPDFIVMAHLYL